MAHRRNVRVFILTLLVKLRPRDDVVSRLRAGSELNKRSVSVHADGEVIGVVRGVQGIRDTPERRSSKFRHAHRDIFCIFRHTEKRARTAVPRELDPPRFRLTA